MIYLGNVVHTSGRDAFHPQWDTMLTLHNKDSAPVTARIRIMRESDGQLVTWDGGLSYFDVVLEPGLTWAASFLPTNGFGMHPPQDFRGHATIECFVSTPFGSSDRTFSVLVFALAAFNEWKYGVNLPIYPFTKPALLAPSWCFAYAIPFFDDSQGATAQIWCTGVSLQNVDVNPAPIMMTYKVAQTYGAHKGEEYSFNCTVPANSGLRFDLLNGNAEQGVPGLLQAGYPTGMDSEGHLEIRGPAILMPSLIIASSTYSFMVGEDPQ